MAGPIFDTHAHYCAAAFDADRHAVLAGLPAKGVTGVVEQIRYWPGKFVNAAYDKAATDNERCGYLLRGEDGAAWTMVQIAGLIARRIVCRVSEGDALERGQRYGMIRFGSRVDLYLPEGYVPSVNIGEQVFAGQSTLATRN